MKTIRLLILSLLVSTAAFSQVQFFMIDNSSAGGPAPSTIRTEAEAFEAYNGISPQANDDATGGSLYDLGYVNATDWAEYSVNLASSGSHNMKLRVAAGEGTVTVTVSVGGTTQGTFTVNNTGGYSSWVDLSQAITFTSSGSQTVRLTFSGSGINLNWFEIDNSYPPSISRTWVMNFNSFFGNNPTYQSGVDVWVNLRPASSADESDIQAGTRSYTNIVTKRLLASTVGFSQISGAIGSASSPSPATDGDGVFPNSVLQKCWKYATGSSFKITGLTTSKTYNVYILSNAQTYEAASVGFTGNSVTFYVNDGGTTATINTSANYGSSATYPTFLTDHALMKGSNIAPNGSGEITITGTASANYVPVNAIVIVEN
jgi:hypothetical protein